MYIYTYAHCMLYDMCNAVNMLYDMCMYMCMYMFHIRCVMNIYRGIIGKRKASLAAVSSILHYIILYYIILYYIILYYTGLNIILVYFLFGFYLLDIFSRWLGGCL